jgi:hypothetical protein
MLGHRRDNRATFDLDQFVADCRAARSEDEPRMAIRDVMQRAMSEPSAVGNTLRPLEGGLALLHHDDELTILNVVWAHHMAIDPHGRRMWAVIGIFAGQEDNAFLRRSALDRPVRRGSDELAHQLNGVRRVRHRRWRWAVVILPSRCRCRSVGAAVGHRGHAELEPAQSGGYRPPESAEAAAAS